MNLTGWKNCKEVFSIDLRALAFFRMGLGALLLMDLFKRSQDLGAHYTDAGIIPRQAIEKYVVGPILSPIHMLSGSFEMQALFFLLAAIFALCLLLGFQSRLATLLSWILLSSLQRRNMLIDHTGDDLLRTLVFWGMFLPLGARFSIDQVFRKNDAALPTGIISLATICFITQYILIYFSSGFLKWKHEVWRQGYALFVTLNIDAYATRLGHLLMDQHTLLTFLTYATLFVEGILPFFLLIPWGLKTIRPLILLILLYFHLGIWMTLEVGLFQPIILLGLICFLPSSFWNEFFEYTKIDQKLDQWRDYLQSKIKPKSKISYSLKSSLPITIFCGLCLAYIFFSNIENWTGKKQIIPKFIKPFGQVLRLQQGWGMFGNVYSIPGGWFVAWGVLENDKQINLLQPQKPIAIGKPEVFSEAFSSHNWRRYWVNLMNKNYRVFHPYFAQYLCRQTHQEKALQSVHIRYFQEITRPHHELSEPFAVNVFDYSCKNR